MFYIDLTWVSATFILLIIKYLSIYHSSIIHSLNEETAMIIIRIFLLLLPPIIVPIEYSYFTNLKDTAPFQMYMGLEPANDSKVEVTSVIVYFTTILSGIVLQTRIELDHLTHQEDGCLSTIKNFLSANQGTVNPNQSLELPYKLSAVRMIFAACMSLVLYLLANVVFGVNDIKNIILAYSVIFLTVCPSTFVLCHQALRTLAINKVKSLCCDDNIFTVTV